MAKNFFVGVDVGTGSVRAAVVSSDGKLIGSSTRSIQTLNSQRDFYEQSSDDIWSSVCHVVKVLWKKINIYILFLLLQLNNYIFSYFYVTYSETLPNNWYLLFKLLFPSNFTLSDDRNLTIFQDVIKEVPVEEIKGIGFDATCSLVALDERGKPVTVSLTGKKNLLSFF